MLRRTLLPTFFLIGSVMSYCMDGVLFIFSAGIAIICLLITLSNIMNSMKLLKLSLNLRHLSIAVASVSFLFMVIEAAITIKGNCRTDTSTVADNIVMPKEYEKRQVIIDGAWNAYYWQGKLHCFNKLGQRFTNSIPAKRQGYCRIAVVGDSLTYGYGVDVSDTYSVQILNILQDKYNVEVLNLGVCGYSSEDVKKLIAKDDAIDPDILFYGVCQNDFLPSGAGQDDNMAYKIPLPDSFKTYLEKKCRIFREMSRAYNNMLINMGVRNDFFDDILKDINNYQRRFFSDVKEISEWAKRHGGIPVVAMVLDQYPQEGGRGQKITICAERYLSEAGIKVVKTDEYYHLYNTNILYISRWEGHPNEKCHRIFAEYISRYLVTNGCLEKYIKNDF